MKVKIIKNIYDDGIKYRKRKALNQISIISPNYIFYWKLSKISFHLGIMSVIYYSLFNICGCMVLPITVTIIYLIIFLLIMDFDDYFPKPLLHLWFKLKSKGGFVIGYNDYDYLGIVSKFKTNNIYYVYNEIYLHSFDMSLDGDVNEQSKLFEKIEMVKEEQIKIKEKFIEEYNKELLRISQQEETRKRQEIYKKNLLEISNL